MNPQVAEFSTSKVQQSYLAFTHKLGLLLKQVPAEQIVRLCNILTEVKEKDGTLWLAGNGGSMATASHIAEDLVNTGLKLKAIALDSPPLLTALANDSSYEDMFAEALGKLASSKDALMLFTVSGASFNIKRAAFESIARGIRVIVLRGGESYLKPRQKSLDAFWKDVELDIKFDSLDFSLVESAHLAFMHIVKDLLCEYWV